MKRCKTERIIKVLQRSTHQYQSSLRQNTWQVFQLLETKELVLIQWIFLMLLTLTSCTVTGSTRVCKLHTASGLLEHIFMNHDNDIKAAAFYFGPAVYCRTGRSSCKLMQRRGVGNFQKSAVFRTLMNFKARETEAHKSSRTFCGFPISTVAGQHAQM